MPDRAEQLGYADTDGKRASESPFSRAFEGASRRAGRRGQKGGAADCTLAPAIQSRPGEITVARGWLSPVATTSRAGGGARVLRPPRPLATRMLHRCRSQPLGHRPRQRRPDWRRNRPWSVRSLAPWQASLSAPLLCRRLTEPLAARLMPWPLVHQPPGLSRSLLPRALPQGMAPQPLRLCHRQMLRQPLPWPARCPVQAPFPGRVCADCACVGQVSRCRPHPPPAGLPVHPGPWHRPQCKAEPTPWQDRTSWSSSPSAALAKSG